MQIRIFISTLFSLIGVATCLAGPPKVVIDTDPNTMGDDGQVCVMASQLYAAGKIDLLGFTVVSGNQWRLQGLADELRNVQRMGIADKVGVYVGCDYPILHDYNDYLLEVALFGAPKDYVGAYSTPEPTSRSQLTPPPDGFARGIKPQELNAVDFLIQTFHKYPHQVTLLAIGPLTNVALAMRKDPTIIPLIKQIVIMGGQIYAPGNAYDDAAEFNWWFDPEAAKVVLRAQVPRLIVPLDVTNTVTLPKATYNAIVSRVPPTIVTEIYKEAGPKPGEFIYDTVAFASFYDPSLDTDVQSLYVDISTTFDANYGKSIVSTTNPYPVTSVLSPSNVVFHINNSAFFNLYTDLFLQPVPVQFKQ
jgi:inosine-uridine nucleoside N-ribohydrolase